MKYLKIYEEHGNIIQLCQIYLRGTDYIINPDETVTVNEGDVRLDNKNDLVELPIQFKRTGNFRCDNNDLLTLKGSPIECGDFDCESNQLTSLEFSPRKVNGCFNCKYNYLNSLLGGPDFIELDYNLANNKVMDFEGFPKRYDFLHNEIFINDNPVNEIINLMLYGVRNKFIKYLIEFDVIRGDKIDELRFEEAFNLVSSQKLSKKDKKFKHYALL